MYTDVGTSTDLTSAANQLKVDNGNITDAVLMGISETTNIPSYWLPDIDGDGTACLGYYNTCDGQRIDVFGDYYTKVGCATIANVTGACPPGDFMTDDERAALINFMRGVDTDGSVRNHMGDMLNTKPIILNYGDETRVFVATNEGFLHSLSSTDGEEAWAFMPKSLLDNARVFMENKPSEQHIYGIDGPITTWLEDWNGNGKIETASTDTNGDGKVDADDNDKAYIYFGLRRGGMLIMPWMFLTLMPLS